MATKKTTKATVKKAAKKATKAVKKPAAKASKPAVPARKITAVKTPMTKSAIMEEIVTNTGLTKKQVTSVLTNWQSLSSATSRNALRVNSSFLVL